MTHAPIEIDIGSGRMLDRDAVLALYRAVDWSAASKPDALLAALANSHGLVTATQAGWLVGVGTALSDGHLVVYYPHLLVHPDCQRQGVGRRMMQALMARYAGFHMQMLTADGASVAFYASLGFQRAGDTAPMWIYAGTEHGIVTSEK